METGGRKKSLTSTSGAQGSGVRAHSQGVATDKLKKRQVTLSAGEEKRARELFDLYDYDKSNTISQNELQDLLGELGIDLTSEAINALLQKKASAVVKITFDEFKLLYVELISVLPTAKRKMQMNCARLHHDDIFCNESLLRSAFRNYDQDKSGQLDRKEISNLLWDLGVPDIHGDDFVGMTNEALEIADLDGSDSIDFHEFVIFINMILKAIHKLRQAEGKLY